MVNQIDRQSFLLNQDHRNQKNMLTDRGILVAGSRLTVLEIDSETNLSKRLLLLMDHLEDHSQLYQSGKEEFRLSIRLGVNLFDDETSFSLFVFMGYVAV